LNAQKVDFFNSFELQRILLTKLVDLFFRLLPLHLVLFIAITAPLIDVREVVAH